MSWQAEEMRVVRRLELRAIGELETALPLARMLRHDLHRFRIASILHPKDAHSLGHLSLLETLVKTERSRLQLQLGKIHRWVRARCCELAPPFIALHARAPIVERLKANLRVGRSRLEMKVAILRIDK